MFKIYITHTGKKLTTAILNILLHIDINLDIEIFLPKRKADYELEYFVRNKNFDACIIDPNHINNDFDGIFLAERIKIINRSVMIIFVSNNIEIDNLSKLINTEPFSYIFTKDLQMQMPQVLKKAISIKIKDNVMFVYTKRNVKYLIPLNDILYFISSHRIIEFICINGKKDSFYEKMDKIESTVNDLSSSFIRVNQSCLINKKYILSISGNEITMVNMQIILVSRKYHKCLEDIKKNIF